MKVAAGILLLLSALFSLLMAGLLVLGSLLLAGLTQSAEGQGIQGMFGAMGQEVPPEFTEQLTALGSQLQGLGGDVQLYMFVIAGVVALSVPLQLVAAINVFRSKGKTGIILGSVVALVLGALSILTGNLFTGAPMALAGILGMLIASKLGAVADDAADSPMPVAGATPPEKDREKKKLDLSSLFKRGGKDPDDEVHQSDAAASKAAEPDDSSDGKKKVPFAALFQRNKDKPKDKKAEKKAKPTKAAKRAAAPPMDGMEKALAGLLLLGVLSLATFAFFRLLEIGAL